MNRSPWTPHQPDAQAREFRVTCVPFLACASGWCGAPPDAEVICPTRRRGVAIVEAALVLGVFLMILLGSLDLAIAVLRNNTVSEAARRLGRAAIVRGEASSAIHTPWGPAPYEGTADENTEFAAAIRDILVVVDPADVQIQMDWPDGDNTTGDRVEVVVSTEYQPIIPSLFGADPYVLRAASTMRIEH